MVALVVFGLLIWLTLDRGWLQGDQAAGPLPAATSIAAPEAAIPEPRASQEDRLDATPTPTELPPGLQTPADPWANTLLDLGLPLLEAGRGMISDGLAWWEGSDVQGTLGYSQETVWLGAEALDFDQQQTVDILVPDSVDRGRLLLVGRATLENGVLALSVTPPDPSIPASHWRVSSAAPGIALKALALQAGQRDLTLTAAYTQNPGGYAQIVLVGVHPERTAETTPDAAAMVTPVGTPSPSVTPTLPPTPTPTRIPEEYMGRVVAGKLDPVFLAIPDFDQRAVSSYLASHPWVGVLSWTENGARIGGRATAVSEASELNFYALTPDDPDGAVSRFLSITYTPDVTRFPADQIYFQGQRMEEVLYWMVLDAASRGGQLLVAYDDFGSQQAITVIGFQPVSTPGS
ncbi:MAG: hypothetical protein Kow00124_07860 [Anaerolineae bacterium]